MPQPYDRSTVKSADRAFDILELLSRAARPLSHSEISAALGIPSSSLSQLLSNLETRRYAGIRLSERGKLYVLGDAVRELAGAQRDVDELLLLGQPIVERISRATGEAASLLVLREREVERVCVANTEQALRFSMTLNGRMPAHAVAGGKAILAFLPPHERAARLDAFRFERITPRTIVSRAAFERELKKVARAGLAYSFEEMHAGTVGVAAPVLNGAAYPLGALNVTSPGVRCDERRRAEIGAMIKTAAADLARQLTRRRRAAP